MTFHTASSIYLILKCLDGSDLLLNAFDEVFQVRDLDGLLGRWGADPGVRLLIRSMSAVSTGLAGCQAEPSLTGLRAQPGLAPVVEVLGAERVQGRGCGPSNVVHERLEALQPAWPTNSAYRPSATIVLEQGFSA